MFRRLIDDGPLSSCKEDRLALLLSTPLSSLLSLLSRWCDAFGFVPAGSVSLKLLNISDLPRRMQAWRRLISQAAADLTKVELGLTAAAAAGTAQD